MAITLVFDWNSRNYGQVVIPIMTIIWHHGQDVISIMAMISIAVVELLGFYCINSPRVGRILL